MFQFRVTPRKSTCCVKILQFKRNFDLIGLMTASSARVVLFLFSKGVVDWCRSERKNGILGAPIPD
jgi:hypothetical protein